MERLRLLLATALATCALTAAPSHALTVIVPDDYPTIQSAISNSAADVILIRGGDYAERLSIDRGVILSAAPAPSGSSIPAFPSVLGISLVGGSPELHNLRIRGTAVQLNATNVTFESCRFDSGYAGRPNNGAWQRMRACMVFGGATMYGSSITVDGCTFVGGGLLAASEGMLAIRGNYIEGPAATGLSVFALAAGGEISGNTIVGATVGLTFSTHEAPNPDIVFNDVRNCSGDAYRLTSSSSQVAAGSLNFQGNRARRCGGRGVYASGGFQHITIQGSVVDSVGGWGISVNSGVPQFGASDYVIRANTVRYSGAGVDVSGSFSVPATVAGNTVLGCGGDGIHATSASVIDHNVVGRCTGHGIAARSASPYVIRNNTLYLNSGSGIATTLTTPDTVRWNIGYMNQRFGVEASGAVAPLLGCNDWYSNWLGVASGVAPSATDLLADPLLCNLPADNATVAFASPCLAAHNSCGPIGALGLGCSTPVTAGVEPDPEGATIEFSAAPRPGRGSIQLDWTPQPMPVTVEVFDAAGARVWVRSVPAATRSIMWDGRTDDGATAPAGVYFSRLHTPKLNSSARIVLIR